MIDKQITEGTEKVEQVIREQFTRVKQDILGNDFAPDSDAGCTTDIGCCKDIGCCEDEGCCQDQGCCNNAKEGSHGLEPVHTWDVAEYIKSDKEPIVTFFKAHDIDLHH